MTTSSGDLRLRSSTSKGSDLRETVRVEISEAPTQLTESALRDNAYPRQSLARLVA